MKNENHIDRTVTPPRDVHAYEEQGAEWSFHETPSDDQTENQRDDHFYLKRYRFTPVDGKLYHQRGFYRAVTTQDDSHQVLQDELQELRAALEACHDCLDEDLDQYVSHFDERIRSIKNQITEEENALRALRAKPEILEQKRKDHIAKIRLLERTISETLGTLNAEKKHYVEKKLENRIDEIRKELSDILDNYVILPEKTFSLGQKKQRELKAVVDDFLGWFKDHRDRTLKRLDELQARKKLIEEKSGLTNPIVQFLYRAGWAAVLATGWFFAAFALSRNALGNEDYVSFVVRRIFSLPASFDGYSLLWIAIYAFLIWIGCLAIVTLVAWLCHRWIKRERPSDRNWLFVQSSVLPRFTLRNDNYGHALAPSSFYNKWLQWLPRLVMLGLAIILLALLGPNQGTSEEDVQHLLTSISAQFVGTLVAFAAAGLGVIYISYVIEPRWLKEASEEKSIPTWRNHIELTVAFGLILAVCGLLPFMGATTDPAISATAFFISLLAGSLTLGYGIKYHGLFEEEREQFTQLVRVERFIQKKAPVLDTSSLEDPQLKKQVDACLQDLLEIVRMKTAITIDLAQDMTGRHRRKAPVSRWRAWLPAGQDEKENTSSTAPLISDIDRKCFGHLAFELESRLEELAEEKQEKQRLAGEIDRLNSRQSELEKLLLKKLHALRTAHSGFITRKADKMRQHRQMSEALKTLYLQYENELTDGYLMGVMTKHSTPLVPPVPELSP